ncbi:hypothetical protein LOZ51_006077 [Ophidiomyces ophidiicola]|nr:hypothetical protein LOZ55_006327 [Ophidiomyces ophidiicola]KAI1985042.1 hypothetical protein LOZ54_004334 [Ophidiomyces ophidiicola]KAI1986483.1 hypothetical protein LOZ51_006077 [Ophidiomyces ophidiicola]
MVERNSYQTDPESLLLLSGLDTPPPSSSATTISTDNPALHDAPPRLVHDSVLSQPQCSRQDAAANYPTEKVSTNLKWNATAIMTTSPQLSDPTQWTPTLSIRTDFGSEQVMTPSGHTDHDVSLRPSLSSTSLPRRTSSIRAALTAAQSSAGSVSPGSVFSSPQLAALTDITPLPSPTHGNSPWRSSSSNSLPRSPSMTSHRGSTFSLKSLDPNRPPGSSSSQRRGFDLTRAPSQEHIHAPKRDNLHIQVPRNGHSRNRSLSEYVSPVLLAPGIIRPSFGSPSCVSPPAPHTVQSKLHREEYLAVQRGIALPHAHPPTPPSTRRGEDSIGGDLSVTVPGRKLSSTEVYHVTSIRTLQPRTYRMIRQLGQGTFSQVSLAVRDESPNETGISPLAQPRLCAVKVVQYGPAGGADEERVEVSLKREVEILKSINHPSIVQLKAFGSDEKRALLVLDYCPGGDLFEFASGGQYSLSPPVIRRIFAELVAAVLYLHRNLIVHRDIKLENVLVNIPGSVMQTITDWRTYPRALVTLTDLGLSRRIPQPPENPLLHTRCGSEDYAAPEILMGQPYDGRSTDGWALGVLLFAMIENRLPFDPLPGTRGDTAKLRARTPHRIARCEWSWYRYGNEDGEWDPNKGAAFNGAQLCVQGLLRRSSRRIGLDEVEKMEWVKEAIDVPDGLKRGDIEVP